jgi:hypothetical protein
VVADRNTTGLTPFRSLPDGFERNQFKEEIARLPQTAESYSAS